MGVYSMSNNGATGTANIFDFDTVAESAFEPSLAAGFALVAQNEANYNAIMKAVGIQELSVLEATGQEMVYEAADVKGFFGKIKQFFITMLQKIAALVKRFFSMVDSYVADDKAFVAKYKGDIIKLKDLKDFSYDGYKFTNLEWSPSSASDSMEKAAKSEIGDGATYDNLAKALDGSKNPSDSDLAALDQIVEKTRETDELHDAMRAASITGAGNAVDASDFAEEIFKFFHNGETGKEEFDSVNPSELLQIIGKTADLKKVAKKAYDEIAKEINKQIKALDKLESDILKLVPGKDEAGKGRQAYYSKAISATNATSAVTRTRLNILTQVYSGQLAAIKGENRQARNVCVKLMAYKPKKESGSFEHYTEGGSFIDGVVLK